MADLDLQSDPLLHLLTDALRAGPGTPAWHLALDRIGDTPAETSAQYRRLMEAREALESGRAYRSVRAGPGFTRKVMEGLDNAPPVVRVPTASLVALGGAAVVLLVLGWWAWALLAQGGATPNDTGQLTGVYFGRPVVTTDFSARRLPAGFRVIGKLPLDFSAASLKLAKTSDPSPAGAGIVVDVPLDADSTFAIEADVRTRGNPDDVVAQVFVSDTPDFSPDRATTAHELAWFVQSARPTVALPGGVLVPANFKLPDSRDAYLVRFVVDPDSARIESAGKLVWSGKHGLSPTLPRYVGVRLIKKGDARVDSAIFKSIRVLKP